MSKRRANQLLREARRAIDAGRPARAVNACTSALELDPASADAYQLRAVAYESRKKLSEAIADYSAALRLRPGTGEVHYNRGFARMSINDAAGAARDFSAALKNATLRDDPDLLLARAVCRLALGKPKPARNDAARLVKVLEDCHQQLQREHASLPPRKARAFLAPLVRRLTEAKQLLAKTEHE